MIKKRLSYLLAAVMLLVPSLAFAATPTVNIQTGLITALTSVVNDVLAIS